MFLFSFFAYFSYNEYAKIHAALKIMLMLLSKNINAHVNADKI